MIPLSFLVVVILNLLLNVHQICLEFFLLVGDIFFFNSTSLLVPINASY